MTVFTLEGSDFGKLSCGQCGIVFYAPQNWIEDRRDKGEYGKEFHCPNGHCRVWRESKLDRIERERNTLKQQTARLEEEIRQERDRANREAKKAAKIKKRAEAALCPCCNRHFSQLERHMKSKHPEIVKLHPAKIA